MWQGRPYDGGRFRGLAQRWHGRRAATVSAPYGPLALIGTHWLEDYPDGRLPDIPGSWRATATRWC